jgi:pyrimidine operon attenuation protein/uracil phosphoribosyltransferase
VWFGAIGCMKIILDAKQIEAALGDLTDRIAEQVSSNVDIAVIGIRSRGEILARRLSQMLSDKLDKSVPCGTLDITLYRDDLNEPQSESQPQVRSTVIPFDINEKVIILVDDVLYTGRSTRAAMDALIDFGRPKAIKLAVLVDRAGRELPIQADYIGCKVDIGPGQSVEVNLVDTDDKDQVIVK